MKINARKRFEEEEEQNEEEEKRDTTRRRILLRCTMNSMVRRRREAAPETLNRIDYRQIYIAIYRLTSENPHELR